MSSYSKGLMGTVHNIRENMVRLGCHLLLVKSIFEEFVRTLNLGGMGDKVTIVGLLILTEASNMI